MYIKDLLFVLVFKIAVVAIIKCARKALNQILCGGDLVLVSKDMGNLREKFLLWKEAF